MKQAVLNLCELKNISREKIQGHYMVYRHTESGVPLPVLSFSFLKVGTLVLPDGAPRSKSDSKVDFVCNRA